MKRMFKNIRAFWKISRMPNGAAWFKIVEDIMKFATQVQEKKVPLLTQIRAISFSKKLPPEIPNEMDIVSLWAGVGTMNPITRLSHLKNQICGLREVLEEVKESIPQTEETKVLHLNIKLILDCTN